MLLSRPVASGAMLVLLMGAVGAAALQQEPAMRGAGVVEFADTGDADGEATAADRVVESAGFPVVPQAERDRAGEPTHGPIVTVNGRPLGEDAPADSQDAATRSAETPASTNDAAAEPQPVTGDAVMVAVEPPRPQPRPEGLGVVRQQDETGIDYDAIAEAARASNQTIVPSDTGFPSPPETQRLAPLGGQDGGYDPRTGYSPEQDELVGVVGPNGEILWVYEEQVPTLNSRVTVQRRQQVPQSNPFGFVYD